MCSWKLAVGHLNYLYNFLSEVLIWRFKGACHFIYVINITLTFPRVQRRFSLDTG